MRSRSSEMNRQTNTASGRSARTEPGVSSAQGVHRRGSALVLVVGTLAIIAVIAALYVTLGQADARVSRGVERGAEVEDIERQVARYIAGVIADDRTAVAVETITNDENTIGPRFQDFNGVVNDEIVPDAGDRYRHIREATDYPYTDYTKVSIITNGALDPSLALVPADYRNMPSVYQGTESDAVNRLRFRPAGDEPYSLDLPTALDVSLTIPAGDPVGLADRRVASDPWLSSLEPTFTGRAEFDLGIGTHDHRNYSANALTLSNVASRQDELFYLDNRDWAHISNLAPNGLSVNLINLRNNFDAESGLGADADGRPRMSENRTLLTINPTAVGGVPQFGIRATEYLHIDPQGFATNSILGPTGPSQYTDPASFAIKNTPAWWTSNQRFLFFPADPSFQILGRDEADDRAFQTVQTPAHPDYPFYQYADADGDGFFDSRWFELTDSTFGPNGVTDLLSNETDLRFFIAARVIDLSGKININVATDGFIPPTNLAPAGATPAEIDLRRQFTGEDAAERYTPVFGNPNASNGTTNPVPLNEQRLSNAHIERLPYTESQAGTGNFFVSGDYEQSSIGAELAFTLPNGVAPLTGNGLFAGRYAYDAIRRVIQGDSLGLPAEVTSLRADSLVGGPPIQLYESTPFEYYSFDPTEPPFGRSLRSGPDQVSLTLDPANQIQHLSRLAVNRRDYYYAVGGANIADPADAPITAEGFGGNLFGLEDLTELLTFNGANDDRVTTRLESVTQGRFDDANGITVQYGPLRANRPTALERRGHDNRFNIVNPGTGQTPGALGGDNLIDFESMALLAINPRTRLTTLSGGSPLRARPIVDRNRDGVISDDERRLTSEDARLDLTASPSARSLFNLYADALIPYSFVDSTWYADPEGGPIATAVTTPQAIYNRFRTLSYGYRGSELGLRLSAHLAVNMRDILDDNDTPSVATVLAAPRDGNADIFRQALDTTLTVSHPSGDISGSPFTWWSANSRFDLGDDRLAPADQDLNNPADPTDFSRKAYSVYGVEPQPFITEVSVITVYSDAPRERLTGLGNGYGDPGLGDSLTDAVEREATTPHYGVGAPQIPESRNQVYLGAPLTPCTDFGWDSGPGDDVNLRFDTSGDNPDLMLHLLAVQVTNPFDVPINLTDNAPAYVTNPNNANEQIPNASFVGGVPGDRLDDIKYYIEFNGHFFPLVEYIETTQYRNLINPFATGPGFFRIILEPGESRVVYVSAHPSLINLTQRWEQIEEVYRNPAAAGNNYSALGDGSDIVNGEPAPETMNETNAPPISFVQNYIDDQLAVRGSISDTIVPFQRDDVVYPARVVPFNPRSGETLRQGLGSDRFVDFMRTNLTYRFPDTNQTVQAQENDIDRMRQEVRLWRKMEAFDGDGPLNEEPDYPGNPEANYLGNDLLADRMRDPLVARTGSVVAEATLDYGTLDWQNIQNRDYLAEFTERFDPFTAPVNFWDNTALQAQNNVSIPLTMSTPDSQGSWNIVGGTNQGLTVAMRAGFRRPDHLIAADDDGVLNDDYETPRGLLPAWCIESTGINHNIAVPTIEDAPAGSNAPQQIATSIEQALNPGNGYFGEYFGFRGCHGHPDFNGPGQVNDLKGGMFYMNFLRFIKDTKVRRDLNGVPLAGELTVRSEGSFSEISIGEAGAFIDDPMLVPTITRHPAVKFVRDEIVNLPGDRDGDGQTDESYDRLQFEPAMEDMRPGQGDVRVAVKRTLAKFGTQPVVDADIIADDPTLLALGRDGLGAASDDRADLVRVGDLALPFGVGPTFAPVNPAADAADFRPGDWTTLGEALSAALGYEPIEFYNTDPGNPLVPTEPYAYSLLSELIDAKGTRIAPMLPDTLLQDTQPYQRLEVLPGGRLDLHAFAPFVNQFESFGTLENTLPQFDPEATPFAGDLNASDYRVGFSEPPAQRLFSMATALDRTGSNPLTNPTIGTLNLNTASEAAMRSVPGFTPSIQFSQAGIEYDLFNANGNLVQPVPNTERMADDFVARVSERTINNAAPVAPLPGREYEPPLGVRSIFGSWETPGSGFPAQPEPDGWKAATDVSASLVAFRDRTRGNFRFASKQNPFLPGADPLQPQLQPRDPEGVFEYTPSLALTAPPLAPNPPIFAPSILDLVVNNYATDFARSAVNGEGPASEVPGLRGIGSMLGLSVTRFDPLASMPQDIANPRIQNAPFTTNWRVGVYEQATQGSVTRNGSDAYAMTSLNQDNNGIANTDPTIPGDEVNLNPNEVGIQLDDNFSYTLGRAGFLNDNPDFQNDPGTSGRFEILEDPRRTLEDEVVDDILEELSVFNGTANMVDVRSDFYAAWFIIRGYGKDDVQGLEPDEPMHPSYEKRFLMVIDRSNVTDAGQQPRVLFLKEVPL